MWSSLAAAVLAATLSIVTAHAADRIQVDVYINGHDDSALLLARGKMVASGLYEKMGIHLNWHTGEAPATPGRPVYRIHTISYAPESATWGALASSELVGESGTEITIYKDRMLRFLDNNQSLRNVAAGYVLAHELAHLMQGVARHSDAGVLKAHWSPEDYKEMVCHKLVFTEVDKELIRRKLAPRILAER